jgi:hypothetical protein
MNKYLILILLISTNVYALSDAEIKTMVNNIYWGEPGSKFTPSPSQITKGKEFAAQTLKSDSKCGRVTSGSLSTQDKNKLFITCEPKGGNAYNVWFTK